MNTAEWFASMEKALPEGYTIARKADIEGLRAFASWIDSWVSNPARAYSHDALEGLFGMTRDRLAELNQQVAKPCH